VYIVLLPFNIYTYIEYLSVASEKRPFSHTTFLLEIKKTALHSIVYRLIASNSIVAYLFQQIVIIT
jgi:hypothetical protein